MNKIYGYEYMDFTVALRTDNFQTTFGKSPETYLEPNPTSAMELLCKIINGSQGLIILAKKALPQIFDWNLNAPLDTNVPY